MKKTFLSLAFATLGIFAFNASAQEACCNPAQACCKTQGQACCKAEGQKKVRNANAFEGITLTQEQQAQIKALNEKQVQARKEAMKNKKDAQAQNRKSAKEARKAYLEDLKKILTPEQYQTYLENVATSTPAKGHKDAKGPRNGKKGQKGDKKGQKGDKGKKQVRATAAKPQPCCE